MRGFWVGVMGLALIAPVGGAFAQDAGAPPTQTPAATQTVPTEDAPAMQDATTPGETAAATTGADVSGWEGPIPEAPSNYGNRLTANAVEAWMAQPRALLDSNPTGGRPMSQFVRSLAGTDNRTIAALVSFAKLPDVRDAQIGATAEGLAGAMRDAENSAPQYAAYIQWAVAQSGSRELIEAFERSSGSDEDRTAAIGAAGGGGPSGAPGSGSLSGAGAPGTSGPVGGDSTVAQTSPGSGSRGGGGSVAFSEGDGLLNGASGRLVVCTLDTSTVGCQTVF